MKRTIHSIVGARPQFVKAAIVAEAFAQHPDAAHEIIHTGQHFDSNMSDVFFNELDIPAPTINLNVRSSLHGEMTGQMMEGLERIFLDQRPDTVVVYGDTNSTMAAALVAAKLHIPIAHVESGMRSFNRMPEEINRVVTDHVSDILFTATTAATQNLHREGIPDTRIHQVGDVMYDCALRMARIAPSRSEILAKLGLTDRPYVLCTVHRAAATDDRQAMEVLVHALDIVAGTLPVVLPLHPRTRARLHDFGLSFDSSGVFVTDPLGYLDMTCLEMGASVITTDSGGVQREAFFHARPCVTLRVETEWVETVDLGWNVLQPFNDASQVAARILERIGQSGQRATPYGTGDAGQRIASIVMKSACVSAPPALRTPDAITDLKQKDDLRS